MPGSATKTNAQHNAQEKIEYIPTARGELYVWSSQPMGRAPYVLVCSSILGEFTANYHRERLLGKELQRRGIGVVRFHYLGEGNSGGRRQDMTFQSLCADAADVVDYARQLRFSSLALVGTRLGALVAASTAATLDSSPLVLWEPLVEGKRFIVDAFRARRMSRTALGADARQDWESELEMNGMLDLLGHDVYRPLVDSLDGLKLSELVGSRPRPLLISAFREQVGGAGLLSDELRERGLTVHRVELDVKEPWWFDRETEGETGDLIGLTADWLSEKLETSK